MTFRLRLLITFLFAVLLPVIALTFFIRGEMLSRFTAQYDERVEALITIIEEDLAERGETIGGALEMLKRSLADDDRFRRAAVDRAPDERQYLLDYAVGAMQLSGLSMLQVQDETGRIISSGHFRNEYDRLEKNLPEMLSSTGNGIALVEARSPDGPFLALAGVETLQMGDRRFSIVAGIRVQRQFLDRLARGSNMIVELIYPGGILTADTDEAHETEPVPAIEPGSAIEPGGAVVRDLTVPFLDSGTDRRLEASFRVIHPLAELAQLRADIDRWFLIVVAFTAVLAIFLISWLSARVSRPLTELAEKTSRIDLDRLNVDFKTNRKDEIGSLSRLLGAMTDRLRASSIRIKVAEREATRAELARQVNHDIKNGLTPIRNVVTHLTEILSEDPTRLPEVLSERKATLDSSITYLETLASNYARLTPRSERVSCDINAIVTRVVHDLRGAGRGRIKLNARRGAFVTGDPTSIRRIMENLVANALDSLESCKGEVVVSTDTVRTDTAELIVRITVADTGQGMTDEQKAKAFNDFYTTKEEGTGLGLSIVRRLVMDMDGSIRVESEVGEGSRFFLDLPAIDTAGRSADH